MRPALFRSCLILCLALLLGACGFQLKGAVNLPYKSIYIGLGDVSPLGADLRRQIRASNAALLAESPKDAEAIFQQLSEKREKVIVSLNTQGRARENQLRLRYSFIVTDPKGQQLIPPQEVVLSRDITYDDNQVLAKDQEELYLWADMQKDLASQILRRLAALQPKPVVPPRDDDAY